MNWEEIVTNSTILGGNIQQTFQEEMQKTILACLSRQGAFNDLVFQGGTALHFFYGNPRFSEDLDFVIREKHRFDITNQTRKIQTFVSNVFPFIQDAKITIQKNDKEMQRLILITVSDVPEQKLRIHLELAYVSSYINQPRILDYPPLNPAVRIEDPSEILADKITALGRRPYLKGRDIWDIYFLIVEKHLSIPWDLVFKKGNDYGTTTKALKDGLLTTSKKIKKEGKSVLSNEMSRFLPTALLDQYRDLFDDITSKVAKEVKKR
jgi:predicted nucleotidyltransferase component of viral defense system